MQEQRRAERCRRAQCSAQQSLGKGSSFTTFGRTTLTTLTATALTTLRLGEAQSRGRTEAHVEGRAVPQQRGAIDRTRRHHLAVAWCRRPEACELDGGRPVGQGRQQ